jgi:SiaC family regulatory phosphoprotein
MEKLTIEQKNKTPKIDFNPQTGIMEISGVSSAENSLDFYRPILNWIDEYKSGNMPHKTVVNVNYKYFNTSSAKCILDMLERFVQIKFAGAALEINWYCEKDDEEMYDAGYNFGDILETPFIIHEIE